MPDYDLRLAQLITGGVDAWLNTPRPPEEASGTSGMKAAHNGVPSVSVRDGWWWEGHVEGVTGWAVGAAHATPHAAEAPTTRTPCTRCWSTSPARLAGRARGGRTSCASTIAINASFFNTQRVLHEYVVRAYHGEDDA